MGIPCLAAGMPSPSPRLISVYLSLCLLTAAASVSVSDSLEDSVSREDSHVKSENEDKSTRQGRQFANFLGVSGHGRCRSSDEVFGSLRVGQWYNSVECLDLKRTLGGEAPVGPGENIFTAKGSCCIQSYPRCGITTSAPTSYFLSPGFPDVQSGSSEPCVYSVVPQPGVCFIRFDLLTMELDVKSGGSCVHDGLTFTGGMEPSGNMCGDRSGEVTLLEVKNGGTIDILVKAQSKAWRWDIGVTQIYCGEVEAARRNMTEKENASEYPCGQKNPSSNPIGDLDASNTRKKVDKLDIKKPEQLKEKPAKKVFEKLKKLPELTEIEKSRLNIYKPSFSRQKLDLRKTHIKGFARSSLDKARILYGNETDINEYPWQISMQLDFSHFCGGTLIDNKWIITAAHCVDLHYRSHQERVTVSLGDHDVEMFGETQNAGEMKTRIKKIYRYPTYDQNYIHGDLALLELDFPVTYNEAIRPACLPPPEEMFGLSLGISTGWGYTEVTKQILPRPQTSDVLREVFLYILPQETCVEYSPFPITDRMVCTYKGPLGVETTCQGDSGGPLVVDMGKNKYTLVGATSFGVASCEGPFPTMYTRITAHLNFIYASMVNIQI